MYITLLKCLKRCGIIISKQKYNISYEFEYFNGDSSEIHEEMFNGNILLELLVSEF